MSWPEILKVNDDLSTPLNELIYSMSQRSAFYFTDSTTFVVPTNCTLTIRACGGGGNGTSYTLAASGCSGGGGGGGYCKDRRKYRKGDVITITIANKNITVTCEARNLNMVASCGGDADHTNYIPGKGGDASGGNLKNLKGGNGGWYADGSKYGANRTPTSGGCGGGGQGDNAGADGIFAGGHGGDAMYVNVNYAHGGAGGNGNFCGGSGGKGGNGYSSSAGGKGGKGGDSAWGIGGCGGGTAATVHAGNGGNGYLMGGNGGGSNSTGGSAIVGPGGYPNGEGATITTIPIPIRPTNAGYGCGGGGRGNNSAMLPGKSGGAAICVIEIGLGVGDY